MPTGLAADALYALIAVLYALSVWSLRRQGRRVSTEEPPAPRPWPPLRRV